jgi:CDP-diacylglycerol--glycerol-3-phosphate 3-phosphatidyltransferase
MDFLDGYVARVTHRTSRLGEILDMHWDGFGVLVASWLLVLYGQVQAWYLVVGLARYLFVAGMQIRERRGLTNYPLPPSMTRRAMAGAQMGFIAVVLLHPYCIDCFRRTFPFRIWA